MKSSERLLQSRGDQVAAPIDRHWVAPCVSLQKCLRTASFALTARANAEDRAKNHDKIPCCPGEEAQVKSPCRSFGFGSCKLAEIRPVRTVHAANSLSGWCVPSGAKPFSSTSTHALAQIRQVLLASFLARI